MKRISAALLALVICLACFASCKNEDGGASSTEEQSTLNGENQNNAQGNLKLPDNFLELLDEKNSHAAVFEANGNYLYKKTVYIKDGSTQYHMYHGTKDRYVSAFFISDFATIEEVTNYTEKRVIDGRAKDNEYTEYLLLGDTFEEYDYKYNRPSGYHFNEDDEITDYKFEDGKIYLSTQRVLTDEDKPTVTQYSYSVDEVQKFYFCDYEIDAETYTILKSTLYLIKNDGTKIVAKTHEMLEYFEYENLGAYDALFASKDTRQAQVNVINATGKVIERYSFDCSKGVKIGLTWTSVYDLVPYTDPSCNTKHTDINTDLSADVTMYVGKKK